MKKILFAFLFCLPMALVAQTESNYSHKKYLKLLGHSKDSVYSIILRSYDEYIQHHTLDYKVRVERCRFIQDAYYDYSEDYNPNYEKAESCARELVTIFPSSPEVLLYRSEFLYGDSSKLFLKKLESQIQFDPETWKNYSWNVYESLSKIYENDSTFKAIRYSTKAMNENDTLDLTLLQGSCYKQQGNNKRAIEVLSSKLSPKQKSWQLNQKGRMLLELGATDKAIEAFHLAKKDSLGWQDSGSLASALIDKGLTSEAREYLQKEASGYDATQAIYKLFDYDIKYGSADSARTDYQKLTESNFWNDPLGIARIRLFFKAPLAHVSFQDVLRILLLILTLVVILLIPYLWILPIHYVGMYLKKGAATDHLPWGLRHLWMAFSMWLFVEFIALSFFNYPAIISWFNDSFGAQEPPVISELTARLSLAFFSGLFFLTLFFLKSTDYRNIWKSVRTRKDLVWKGVGLALLLRIPLGIYLVIIKQAGWAVGEKSFGLFSVNDDIISINQYFHPWVGFLFVVILVPFYEEILFRGVFLSACQKHLNFVIANFLQAFVFALAHQNLKLFLFYFGFGLIAGYYRKQTNSFSISMAMHVTNNMIAFFAILWLKNLMG